MRRLESARSRRRREVREGLRASVDRSLLQPRTLLLPAEARAYFEAIDSKNAPNFGLVKLAALDLNTLHPAPVRKLERGGPLALWAPAISLLAYAAHRQVDGICAALLRAGADPSVRWSPAGAGSIAWEPGVQAYAASLRPAYSVWLVRTLVEMRRVGAQLVAAETSHSSAAPSVPVVCVACTTTLQAGQPLAWGGSCSHPLCEPCFWRLQMAHNHVLRGGEELHCPVCRSAATAAEEAAQPPWLAPASSTTAAERAERKMNSARKFAALPATQAEAAATEQQQQQKETASKKRPKGGRIRALPERAAAALNPGWLRSDRIERLNEAACADDVLRALGILEAGVDLDGTSECGETPAISAAMFGHATVLRVLCWAGADLTKVAHGGASAASAASARGHEAALLVLHEYMAADGGGGLPPPLQPAGAQITKPTAEAGAAAKADTQVEATPQFHPLIITEGHPGCGSGFVDGGFTTAWLERLHSLWAGLPGRTADPAAATGSSGGSNKSFAKTCAERSLFCDAEGWVEAELGPLAAELLSRTLGNCVAHSRITGGGHTLTQNGGLTTPPHATLKVMPRMRFLCYHSAGGSMQPHVDLAKRDPTAHFSGSGGGPPQPPQQLLSTHTFMVHLENCAQGGETVLLQRLTSAVESATADGVLAAVAPVRGRLLVFPHGCPHAGLATVGEELPKLFLRGELLYSCPALPSNPPTQAPGPSPAPSAALAGMGGGGSTSQGGSGGADGRRRQSETLAAIALPWQPQQPPPPTSADGGQLRETATLAMPRSSPSVSSGPSASPPPLRQLPEPPLKLGPVGRPTYERILWRLVDHGLCPRIVPITDWCGGGGGGPAVAHAAGPEPGGSEAAPPLSPAAIAEFFGALPASLDPGNAESKISRNKAARAHRKRCQIVAIARLVEVLLPHSAVAPEDGLQPRQRPLIVDFCGGAGHLGLVLAACHPAVDVLCVDFNAFKLTLGAARAVELGLSNFQTQATDIALFQPPNEGSFALGIALHACGSATDLALAACSRASASFIVSPCCVGKVAEYRRGSMKEGTRICDGRASGLKMPRSDLLGACIEADEYLSLAGAADYHSKETPSPLRAAAKSFVELDRLAAIAESTATGCAAAHAYRVRMGKLPRFANSPKDDVLWGWRAPPPLEPLDSGPAGYSCNGSDRATATWEALTQQDRELRRRWSTSVVYPALIEGGLWLHEAAATAAATQEQQLSSAAPLPDELSVLAPDAGPADIAAAMALIRKVVAARDDGTGLGWWDARVAVEAQARGGYDAQERNKYKAMRRARWANVKALGPVHSRDQMQREGQAALQTGPASNARAGRRLLQVLARAACVCTYHDNDQEATTLGRMRVARNRRGEATGGGYPASDDAAGVGAPPASAASSVVAVAAPVPVQSTLFLVPPPHWPFICDDDPSVVAAGGGGIQLAGAALEEAVAEAAALVPVVYRRGLTARRMQLGHRLTVLSADELLSVDLGQQQDPALLQDTGVPHHSATTQNSAGQQGQGQEQESHPPPTAVGAGASSGLRVIHSLLASAASTLGSGDALAGLALAAAAGPQAATQPTPLHAQQTEAQLELAVSGAIASHAPAVRLYTCTVRWPQAAAWRKRLGLREQEEFVVELGL